MTDRDVTRIGADGVVRAGESADLIAIAEGQSSVEDQNDDMEADGDNYDNEIDHDAPVEDGGYDPSYDGAGPLPGR